MSSSISGSDPARSTAEGWRRFIVTCLAWTAGLCVTLVAVAYVVDPYDTGFGLVRFQGAFAKGPRLGDASRVHDAAFDSAIIGNSHIMSLSPGRLSRLTGLKVVMLGIPGTGVPEQMQVLDAYLARHEPPKALIVGVDRSIAPPIPAYSRLIHFQNGFMARTVCPMSPALHD